MPDAMPLSVPLLDDGGPPREILRQAAASGFRFVQIACNLNGFRPRELDASARRDLCATLNRLGLACSGLDCFIPVSHFADPARQERVVDAMREAIDLAVALGRCPVSVELPARDDGRSAEAVAAVVREAARLDIEIADHSLHASRWPMGVGIDPAAAILAGRDCAAVVLAAGHALSSARLSDAASSGVRVAPGLPGGRLDLIAYRAALDVAGYRRPVVIDVRGMPDFRGVIAAAQRAWSLNATLR
jgi:sugar phosphate isomerase/epimerase